MFREGNNEDISISQMCQPCEHQDDKTEKIATADILKQGLACQFKECNEGPYDQSLVNERANMENRLQRKKRDQIR